jgi:excisionase family DNA binding protein
MSTSQIHDDKVATRSELREKLIQQALTANEKELQSALAGLKGDLPKPTLEGPLLIAMGKAAELLGVSRVTLWRMVKQGRIPKLEILPGSYRIRRTDLEEYLQRKDLLVTGTDSAVSGDCLQPKCENRVNG